jgi:hypothetical protein
MLLTQIFCPKNPKIGIVFCVFKIQSCKNKIEFYKTERFTYYTKFVIFGTFNALKQSDLQELVRNADLSAR